MNIGITEVSDILKTLLSIFFFATIGTVPIVHDAATKIITALFFQENLIRNRS
jgi:hypothetical protein